MNKIKMVQCNIVIPDELYKQIKLSALDQDIPVKLWMHRAIIEILAHEQQEKDKYK